MNTQHFRYALEVEKTGSITQAAENLFMGQPNLSKSIKELEDNLGIVIFKRTSRGVVPTASGKAFLKYARGILAQIDEMQSVCRNDLPDMQKFNVCVPRGSYASCAASDFVLTLDSTKPMNIKLGETNSIDGINMVADGVFGIGIIRYRTQFENYFLDYMKEKGLASETVWEFDYLVIMSENNPISQKQRISLEDLSQCTEITYGDCNVPYINIPQSEESYRGGSPKKSVDLYGGSDMYSVLSKLQGSFMWGSALPEELLRRYSLVQRRCDAPGRRYKDVLVYREGARLGYLERRFLDKLFEVKNKALFGGDMSS